MFSSRTGFFVAGEEGPVNPLANPRPMFEFDTSYGDLGGNLVVAGTFSSVSNSTFATVTQPAKGFVYAQCSKPSAGASILALAYDGTLYAVGAIQGAGASSFDQIGSDSDWATMSMGLNHAAAIKTNGDLYMWGDNFFGQLGFGDSTTRTSPTKLGTNKWFSVSCGSGYTVAVDQDGKLWAWGDNDFGQLGRGNTTDSSVPVEITAMGTDNWFPACGAASTWVLKQDNTVYACGDNGSGRLGLGNTTTPQSSYSAVSTTNTTNDYRSISSGANQVCYFKTGTSQKFFTNGLGSGYRLGTGNLTTQIRPIQVGTADWLWTSGGFQNGAGIQPVADNYGNIYTWGSNTSYRTGQNTASGTTNNPTQPASGTTTNAFYIDAGALMTVAIVG